MALFARMNLRASRCRESGYRTARTARPSPIHAASTRVPICPWPATRAADCRSSSACSRDRSIAQRSVAMCATSRRRRERGRSMSDNSWSRSMSPPSFRSTCSKRKWTPTPAIFPPRRGCPEPRKSACRDRAAPRAAKSASNPACRSQRRSWRTSMRWQNRSASSRSARAHDCGKQFRLAVLAFLAALLSRTCSCRCLHRVAGGSWHRRQSAVVRALAGDAQPSIVKKGSRGARNCDRTVARRDRHSTARRAPRVEVATGLGGTGNCGAVPHQDQGGRARGRAPAAGGDVPAGGSGAARAGYALAYGSGARQYRSLSGYVPEALSPERSRNSARGAQPPRAQAGGVTMDQNTYDRGLAMRRKVLGEEYVDRQLKSADDFNRDFQRFVTQYCWGEAWGDDTLKPRERSILNLGMIAALGKMEEFQTHVRGALRNGLTPNEIRAVLTQIAVYCGVPVG